ncbi:hypothetical protein [Paraburkholderia hayleyella]|uniref:hypothetical protein n=1 Tax=Paraburkholderia hayleyella TaxID=2152889 RepID=UPI0012922D98|nr:hypothetical protein [Paraburkholderia hayleyella]
MIPRAAQRVRIRIIIYKINNLSVTPQRIRSATILRGQAVYGGRRGRANRAVHYRITEVALSRPGAADDNRTLRDGSVSRHVRYRFDNQSRETTLGVMPIVIERCLNPVSSLGQFEKQLKRQLMRHDHQYRYWREMRAAWQELGAFMEKTCGDEIP